MIIPRVKKETVLEGRFEKKLSFAGDVQDASFACLFLQMLLPKADLDQMADPSVFLEKKEMEHPEGYELKVTQEKVCISYQTSLGLRNAVATLAQLYHAGTIGCTQIWDAPDEKMTKIRSGMLDLARGFVEIPALKEDLLQMAALKYNFVHFHLMDSVHYVIDSKVIPVPAEEKVYTMEEMKDIVDYCTFLGLEIIPEFEIPAHARNMIRLMPQLACTNAPDDWVVCVGKETTFEIYEKIIEELCELFPGRYLHMGGDELYFHDLTPPRFCGWLTCPDCQRRMKKEGLTTEAKLFYYMVRRLNDKVRSLGKTMILWSDQLDVTKPVDLPRNIVMEFWRIAGEGRGPHEGCTFQKQLDLGFEIFNAQYQYTYTESNEYMQAEPLRTWTPDTEFGTEVRLKGNLVGGECCSWELGNPKYAYYGKMLAPCLALFADRMWNPGSVTAYDETYRTAMARAEMGDLTEDLDLYGAFPDLIPSRTLETPDTELARMDKETVAKTVCLLEKADRDALYGKTVYDATLAVLKEAEGKLK